MELYFAFNEFVEPVSERVAERFGVWFRYLGDWPEFYGIAYQMNGFIPKMIAELSVICDDLPGLVNALFAETDCDLAFYEQRNYMRRVGSRVSVDVEAVKKNLGQWFLDSLARPFIEEHLPDSFEYTDELDEYFAESFVPPTPPAPT